MVFPVFHILAVAELMEPMLAIQNSFIMPPKSRYSLTQSEAVSSGRPEERHSAGEVVCNRLWDTGSRACLVVSYDNFFPLQILALELEEPKEACGEVELLTALSLCAILRTDLLVVSLVVP